MAGFRLLARSAVAAAAVAIFAALFAVAHPEDAHVDGSPEVALQRRAAQLARRDAAAQCASSLARRDDNFAEPSERLFRRAVEAGAVPETFSLRRRASASCTADPEITAGPYYINGYIHRDNIVESQEGFLLLLEITFMDIATCSPLVGAAVEFWNCNVTGFYSGFGGSSECIHGSGSGSTCMTSQETFLRGWVYTDDSGVAEMTTMFPSFYDGRAPHLHMAIHTGGSEAENGTYVGGGYRHIAQLFPGDTAALAVYQVESGPYYSYYTANKDTYVSTDDDTIRSGANYEDYGNLDLTQISSSDLSKGYVGTVTVYVDTTASYSDPSTNYYDSSVSFESAATSVSGVDVTTATASGSSTTATVSTTTGSSSSSSTGKSSSTSGATKATNSFFLALSAIVVAAIPIQVL
ncbi:hypothetical protein HK405_007416 [Cladochytrium tenue]|nr:hypothetical protein HK405_007416 [Cladochytrium tenue]